jgi:hypothetical protein
MALLGSTLALFLAWGGGAASAKSYGSGGGHSYSHSSSSHSFSSGSHSFSSGSHSSSSSGSHSSGSTSFHSGSGKSYSSGSIASDHSTHSYSSGRSYSSGAGHSSWLSDAFSSARTTPGSDFAFDTAAAQARKQRAGKARFDQFNDAQRPPAMAPVSAPPTRLSTGGGRSANWYIPDSSVLVTRRTRVYNVFNPYWSRPMVVYNDPYNSFFWWWLLDRSLDDRAWWAYHHHYDMDPARYQALLATDQQLQDRVQQLEAQQAARDPNYVPPGLDQDLMYSDQYVSHAYSNRPTTAGKVAFWGLGIPVALGFSGFFIWLIWFKRW